MMNSVSKICAVPWWYLELIFFLHVWVFACLQGEFDSAAFPVVCYYVIMSTHHIIHCYTCVWIGICLATYVPCLNIKIIRIWSYHLILEYKMESGVYCYSNIIVFTRIKFSLKLHPCYNWCTKRYSSQFDGLISLFGSLSNEDR